ncbi:DNA mobilization endonuclease VirD1/MobC family subunit [Rhizobium skierniewicense]|uniref:DNA mobilization endonuclease VirD1/MobC family subunit n=1 Tax=Rhizobium TaxID=379 RepID=UPI00178647D9|nr:MULTISPECIES: DNA mobilization endonuclease VirD1/MobC family subunit [Rhizobium]MBD8689867.1 DNA mobilization endonuclease VirD1/MobC family subunit [Rhizobium sp. CFBP 13644]MBD8694456.1 DNA mobilization endonuclease VirD1/MobC family subunit [Rhizobium sp. CFBP 13717]MCI9868557.1 DNA mobilization endonuclease VirD1/MobC family subunit [Rhizobium skierniewicense]
MDEGAQPHLPWGAVKDQKCHGDQERFTVVSVRLRLSEFEEFSRQASSLGLSNSMAMRAMIRRAAGFLEIEAETRVKLEETNAAIVATATKLSELSRTFSAGGADLEALKTERAHFGRSFAELDSLLRTILNVSRRRIDGRTLLKEVAGL